MDRMERRVKIKTSPLRKKRGGSEPIIKGGILIKNNSIVPPVLSQPYVRLIYGLARQKFMQRIDRAFLQ